MAFLLSGKLVALHLDKSTAKAYLCDQDCAACTFLRDQPATFCSLANMHGINLLLAYLPIQSGTFFLIKLSQHFNLGVNKRWICWHPHMPINISIITPWKLHYLWEPWGWTLSTILRHSGELCIPPHALLPQFWLSFGQNMSQVNSDF